VVAGLYYMIYTETIVNVLMEDKGPCVIYTRKHNFGLHMNNSAMICNGADIWHSFIYLSFGEIQNYVFTLFNY
jgi:hypothetical protein